MKRDDILEMFVCGFFFSIRRKFLFFKERKKARRNEKNKDSKERRRRRRKRNVPNDNKSSNSNSAEIARLETNKREIEKERKNTTNHCFPMRKRKGKKERKKIFSQIYVYI